MKKQCNYFRIMTHKQFKNAAFYIGQKAIFDGILPVEIIGFSAESGRLKIKSESGKITDAEFDYVELLHPDPRSILREILRRLKDPLNEGYQTRMDSDLKAQIEKVFEDEK